MPERETIERAERARRQGKSPSSQAGEFVRKRIDAFFDWRNRSFDGRGIHRALVERCHPLLEQVEFGAQGLERCVPIGTADRGNEAAPLQRARQRERHHAPG